MEQEIELFRLLINRSPSSSFLKVNGFYSSFISEKSFQKLFNDVSLRQKTSSYLIPLTDDLKKSILDILDEEKEALIYDLTHFCIENDSEILVESYDTMDFVKIKTRTFGDIQSQISQQFSELEFDEKLDGEFFDHIKPSEN